MIISSSAIQLSSQRTSIEMYEKQESLSVWKGDRNPGVSQVGRGHGRNNNPSVENKSRVDDRVSLHRHGHMRRRHVDRAEMEVPESEQANVGLNMKVLMSMFERITGRKFQMVQPISGSTSAETPVEVDEAVNVDQPVETADSVSEDTGFGMVYDYHETRYEYEKTEFQSEGIIKTGDGNEISFNVSLSMSREFYSEQNVHVAAGDALKDPLVVNFSGTAAEVTQRDFQFDIDADGQVDQIGFVGPGSGFLALDKNGDGEINDGTELFGAQSGDGFADLAAYDLDGNSWIDEKDAIYESLRIWSKNENGEDSLMALGEVGVGAIYLEHIETLFNVKDSENELLGQVKETGIAIMEGTNAVVTVQQLDLVA